MRPVKTFLVVLCLMAGSAMAQSNLAACGGDYRIWTDCFGTDGGYVGEFKDGKFNGQGTYTYYSGDKYVGEFKDGTFNGQGIEFNADGSIQQSGIFEKGKLVRAEVIDPTNFTRIKLDQSLNIFTAGRLEDLEDPDSIRRLIFAAVPNAPSDVVDEAVRLQIIENKQLKADAEKTKREKVALEAHLIAEARQQAEAEEAKRKQAELQAQLVAAQQQTQVKPTAQIAPQGKRVALVIGNAKYKFNPLNNPVNDATDMAASLRSVGFDVIEVKDATLKQMRAATRQFADKLEVSDVGLVYYSGHGIEVKGKNYLIPVNADIRREYEVVDQAFDASNLLRMMEGLQSGTKKRVNILIVDACRNNDLPKSWRSTNNGLARMDAPAGSFISFATAPGQVASDGQGRNSPYTKHLLQALKQPGMPIEQVFKQVRRKVMAETAGEQVPWENSSLVGDFYFTVAR